MLIIRCSGVHFASRKAAVVVSIDLSRNQRRSRIPRQRLQAYWPTGHPSLFNVPHRYRVDEARAGYQLCCTWLGRNLAKVWKVLHTDIRILYWRSHRALRRHKSDKIKRSSLIQKIWINRDHVARWWIRGHVSLVVDHCVQEGRIGDDSLHAADSCRF